MIVWKCVARSAERGLEMRMERKEKEEEKMAGQGEGNAHSYLLLRPLEAFSLFPYFCFSPFVYFV